MGALRFGGAEEVVDQEEGTVAAKDGGEKECQIADGWQGEEGLER